VKLATVVALVLISTTTGCFWRGEKKETNPSAFTVKPTASTNLVIKPSSSAVGRVASVNLPGRFVVLSFPVGQVPTNNTRLAIFHAGAKVGEVRVTGPAQENLTVGDITAGAAEDGDEARSE